MRDFWKTFLTSNETKYRLGRTILQGVIGVIIAYLDAIVGMMAIPNEMRPMIVALVMAVLSPIMSELGATIETNDVIAKEQYTFNMDSIDKMMGVDNGKENDTTA
jgi:hypothetical protein